MCAPAGGGAIAAAAAGGGIEDFGNGHQGACAGRGGCGQGAVPSILASMQLFVFGTWLPHRPGHDDFPDRHNARSTRVSDPLSLLTCFHFGGYHHEHHLHPSVPWWRLPSTRRTRA